MTMRKTLAFGIAVLLALTAIIGFGTFLPLGANGASVSSTYAITITNSANANHAMVANWNYQVTIPYNSSSGLNGNFSNIRFTLDSNGSIELYAWLQSYNATAFNAWLLINETLNIGASITLFYQIESSTTYFGAHWGLSPVLGKSLLGTYGASDNGANVFTSLYANFGGVTFPSGWTASYTTYGSYTQNNGLTLNVTSTSGGTALISYNTLFNESQYQIYTYIDSYVNTGGYSGANEGFSFGNTTTTVFNTATSVFADQLNTTNSAPYGNLVSNTSTNSLTSTPSNIGGGENQLVMSSLYLNYTTSPTAINAIYSCGNVFSTGNSLGLQYTGGTTAMDTDVVASNDIGSALGYPVIDVSSGAYITGMSMSYVFVIPSLSLMPDPLGFMDFQALSYTVLPYTEPVFTVSFVESGLASGTNWYVNFYYPSGTYQVYNSTTNTITITNLVNATYTYTAFTGNQITLSGQVIVNGNNQSISLAFASVIGLNGIYNLTFLTSGINYGTTWTLNITETTVTGFISFTIQTPNFESESWANGTYAYTASATGYNQISGTFSILGNSTTVIIYFTPLYQNQGNTTSNNTTLNVDITVGILIATFIIMAIGAYYGGTVIGLMVGFIVLVIGRLLGYIPTWIIIAIVVVASAGIAFRAFLSGKDSNNEGGK